MLSSATTALEKFVTDTWVKATWDQFLMLADNPDYENGRFYYHQGYVRIEMSPVGQVLEISQFLSSLIRVLGKQV